jgi:hypothetical protein
MKSVLVTLMVLMVSISAAAKAAPLEDAYFASRDAYIDKFKPAENSGNVSEGVLREEKQARADLEKQLRRIIGPTSIQGIRPQGKINLETLFKDELGFGQFDGLVYSSADGKTQVLVTTDALFEHWLRDHKDWWGSKLANVPQEMRAALQSEAFYTQALSSDAAVFKYVDLPITKPAQSSFAFAMLDARGQDIGPRMPDELIVAVVQGRRVYVISAPARAKISPMPACQKIWDEATQKAADVRKASAGSDAKADQADRIEEEGDAAFRKCFAQRAESQGFYATLTRQAQALVGRLPTK